MLNRRLTLRREALAPLTTDEMSALAAAGGPTGPQPTPPIYAPRSLKVDECVGPTLDSMVVCSVDCTTRGTTCAC